MNTKLLLLTLSIFMVIDAHAQTYNLSISSGVYTNLEGSTSLNNGWTWDDPNYEVPVGFDFAFFKDTFSTIYFYENGLGGFLSNTNNLFGIVPVLIAYGHDIIDRGYDIDIDSATQNAQSNLSYLLEGTPGNRIFKLEWNNVGFYNDISTNNVSTDYVNFQLWLYEGSNDIELRFGPSLMSNPNISFEGDPGPIISLIEKFDPFTGNIDGEGIMLSGDPEDAQIKNITSFFNYFTLSGNIPDGTIYKFSRKNLNKVGNANLAEAISIFPNPTNGNINITNHENSDLLEGSKISILDGQGKEIRVSNYNSQGLNVQDLISGVYFIQINTKQGIITRKLLKQ